MNLCELNRIAFAELGEYIPRPGAEKGGKYYHGQRVAKLSVHLRKLILPDDASHDDILTVTGWFHDIRNGYKNHAQAGAERTRQLLEGTDIIASQELDEVCQIISIHDDRYNGRDIYSNRAKLQQDADHLDHFGTLMVWQHFIYCRYKEIDIHECARWLAEDHVIEDDARLSELNFDVSRDIYRERAEFLDGFAKRFLCEINGDIWSGK